MLCRKAVTQSIPLSSRAASTRAALRSRVQNTKVATASGYASRRQQHFIRSLATVTLAGGVATISQYYLQNGLIRDAHAEAPAPEPQEVQFEKARKRKATSKEDNRDLISSQHLQVKRSWENPGVYAWGSNTGKVVAPDSDEKYIKSPRRIPFFDGMLLRDIKLDRTFGAAIDEKGNLLQWGTGYSPETTQPTVTLKGKNLVSLTISRDRIIGLSSSGKVYSIPVSAEDQQAGTKPSESSWIPFWSSTSPISYRNITIKDLPSWNEKVTNVKGGLEHILLLTSKGRLYSAASASEAYPSRGQLGVPGLTWLTKPTGPYDQPHEITTLKGFDISKIACGDYHSVVADKEGRVFTFGDNSMGQLGFEYNPESSIIDAPALLPIQKLYSGTSQTPVVTDVAAGGANSYLTIDATKVTSQAANPNDPAANRGLGRVTADTFAFGFTNQDPRSILPFEYDEVRNQVVPIRLSRLSVGATHAAAVMANVTHLAAGDSQSHTENETNWGADILFWGGNEFYQLGTGKRNNMSTPTYILALDQVAERKMRGKEDHRFQITPRKTVKLPDGRTKSVEQKVECGRYCTAVYSGV
ncbi:hypothetical protein H2203_007503 [Taxawa tesnikishii (nom. ined.)]|nr:hypothetical protein H2203_007503 [Dothideales sp. JES 119]